MVERNWLYHMEVPGAVGTETQFLGSPSIIFTVEMRLITAFMGTLITGTRDVIQASLSSGGHVLALIPKCREGKGMALSRNSKPISPQGPLIFASL